MGVEVNIMVEFNITRTESDIILRYKFMDQYIVRQEKVLNVNFKSTYTKNTLKVKWVKTFNDKISCRINLRMKYFDDHYKDVRFS